MDRKTAKQIGQRLAVNSAKISIVIAYAIFAWVTYGWDHNLQKAILWIFNVEFWYHLMIGGIGLLTVAYLFGQLAEIEILMKTKEMNCGQE